MCVCVGFYLFIYLPPRSWFVYFQGHRSQQFEIGCIIPGREIPKWFEKVNICDTSVVTEYQGFGKIYKVKKVKIQLPGSGSGCDEWRGIVLCFVFLPPERHHKYQLDHRYQYHYYRDDEQRYIDRYSHHLGHSIRVQLKIGSWDHYSCYTQPELTSEYGEVESHHLWLHSLSKNKFCLPKTPGRSIDKKGFHQVELEIETEGFEVEKIGFRVV